MTLTSDRDAYLDKLQGRIDELAADIDKLKARARQAGAATRLEMNDQLARLKSRRDELSDSLDDLADTAEESWEDSRHEVSQLASSIIEEIRDVERRLEMASTTA